MNSIMTFVPFVTLRIHIWVLKVWVGWGLIAHASMALVMKREEKHEVDDDGDCESKLEWKIDK